MKTRTQSRRLRLEVQPACSSPDATQAALQRARRLGYLSHESGQPEVELLHAAERRLRSEPCIRLTKGPALVLAQRPSVW